jgi:hypothetical protein
MLTAQDDSLGHQTSEEFSKVAIEDTRSAMYTERFWYMGAVVPEGNFVFGLGLGYYPNRGVMDCYAAVTLDNVQYNLRASRTTGRDPLVPCVGPVRIHVEQGLKQHRLVVEPNESDVSLDLKFVGLTNPNDEGREVVQHKGRVVSDVRRFVQAGAFEGHIRVAGETFAIERNSSIGFRDRSWGLRVEARTDESTPPVSNFPAIFYVFLCAIFKNYSIHLFFKESAPGEFRFLSGDITGLLESTASKANKITHVEHDLVWREGAMSQEVEGGRFVISLEDGSVRELTLRSLGGRLFLKGGLYGGLNGWFQGDNRGELDVGCNRWDLRNAADRKVTRTLAEQVVEVRDGSATGFGTIQCGVGANYPKYDNIQVHPAQ